MTILVHSCHRDAMEWEWVLVVRMIANGISMGSNRAMVRKLTRRGNVVCFDDRMLAFERIDSLGFDCSSRADLDRLLHVSQ